MTFDFSKVTAIVPGSLSAVATSGHISLAESFINADHIVLVDVSGSMTERDSRDGQSRYDVACQELRKLQGELPGSIAIVAFASKPQFCPSGVPMMDTATGFGTDLAQGLRFIAPADGLVDVWVISDGEPNNEQEALTIARRMTSRINAVYVGPKGRRRRRLPAATVRHPGRQGDRGYRRDESGGDGTEDDRDGAGSGMKRAPETDHNPERVRCALCGDTKSRWERVPMLPGPVCEDCRSDAAPESAPYWNEWNSVCRRTEAHHLPFSEARKRAGRAQQARDRQRRRA